jgi:hypothetical protein
MPGVRVGHRDHPVRGGAPGDPPPSVAPVRAPGRLHVLPGDQGQQACRVRGRASRLGGQARQQGQRVVDQGADQRRPGLLVVPGDLRLARVPVVVSAARDGRLLSRAGHLADHPPDGCHQLGHRVLGRYRVIEHGGVQRPALLPGQRPGGRHDFFDLGEQPARVTRARQPPPEVRQQRRVEAPVQQPQPAGSLPPQVAPHRLRRVVIRQPVQRLQHHHRREHLRRHARPPVRRGVHVREHPRREQRVPVPGQEREHAPRRDQLPARLPHIRPGQLSRPLTLHTSTMTGRSRTVHNQPRSSAGF